MFRKLMFGAAAMSALLMTQAAARTQAAEAKDIVTTAVNAGSFKTLATALKAAGLVETLQGKGPFTVFAPSDAAFASLPAGTVEKLLQPENKQQLVAVLAYHVVPGKVMAADVTQLTGAATVNGQRIDIKVDGSTVFVDQAKVVAADIACSNGVIHVIDQVILPSSDDLPTTALNAGKFGTLLAAAKAAGLVSVLSGDEPLTVFAPTDAAFEKLPDGVLESLLLPKNKDKLAAVLKYHVVAGRVYSNQVLDQKELKTVQGGVLTVSVKNGVATINGAGLAATDIDASNGVIHVIDSVLLPAAPDQGANIAPAKTQHVSRICPTTGRVVSYRVLPTRGR
ncbi:fasciclin domain-containing protein [Lignipirellula cremea]|uniref:Immunogenic protein MPT70 n=1 Tax=Lignipirellula cremea TaxID=2528010 RepID=A0A518DKV5_9BACT|nr:fasciclin domain-containing protein [Lignipirellula cremea]QDU92469.1 Immunogenic protein MPT70 precursor [Lignipirellula cremea]